MILLHRADLQAQPPLYTFQRFYTLYRNLMKKRAKKVNQKRDCINSLEQWFDLYSLTTNFEFVIHFSVELLLLINHFILFFFSP